MLFFLIAAVLHPVHETVAEIEWNAKSRRLEVALRLDVLDEQWLRKKYAQQQQMPQWAIRYLRQHFRICDLAPKKEPDPATYRWVGRKPEGSHAWWYFEIQTPDNKPPVWVEQRVLYDREPNYSHRILILEKNRRRSLDLNAQRPKANLDEAEDDTKSTKAADR